MSLSAVANPIEWQTYKQQDDIKVSYKKHETGIIEINASVLVKNAKASDFMALLSDTDNAPNWLENVKSVTLMERLSPSETLVYTHFNSPWPVLDRDLVSYSCYHALGEHKTELKIISQPYAKAEVSGVVRIKELRTYWRLEEQQSNLLVSHQAYADPGGSIPHWLSNKVSLKSVYKTLQALTEQLTNNQFSRDNLISQLGSCS
ncbi:MAG: START domain-containing protein [Pseudoalteromonas sp.]|uniref:START domain-containing protein n=1 Tax=Pseudoalteromonas sp. TaxID=53249 RepID=UPI0025E9AE6F|nr:START domain-containing protein [Pseudoalteromonas sp.]MCH2086229.1 START domain-containing protein [Pseudoalteromonas sp.]